MNKKREGSSILMVLMIATILTILSAVVCTALVSTTNINTIAKYKNDYVYAAEGGIELGIQKFTEVGKFTGDMVGGVDKGIKANYLSNPTATDDREIYEVRVKCEDAGSQYNLISTVTNKNGDELCKITLPVNGRVGIAKILEYTVCTANNIDLKSKGSFTFNPAKVAYNSFGGATKKIDGSTIVNPKIDDIDVRKVVYSNYVGHKNTIVEYKTLNDLVNDAKSLRNGFQQMTSTKESSDDGKLDNGLGYMNVGTMDVIIVSADQLKISGMDPSNTPPELQSTLNQTIIICNGKIVCGGGDLHLNKSTLYSNQIEMNLNGSLFMAGAPLYTTSIYPEEEKMVAPSSPNLANGNISEKDLNDLDELFMKYMTSYGASSNIGGKPEVSYDDVIYEY